VRGLARLHSAYWGDRLTANPALGWVEPFVAFEGMQYAPLHIAHERLGDTVAAEILGLTGEQLFIDIWACYIATLTTSPQTLLHGDPHIGNTYVLPDDDVGFLDWQMVRRGNWSLDVGYFVQGALTIEERRRSERELLDEYRAALTLPADEMPSQEDVLLRYRASVAHGLAIWMATLSGGDAWQSPDVFRALAQRYAAAFIDLDSRAAIDAIA
jgi:aminoglycoside phosphotransferase (APT) family kinase protein